ncbi:hypothetical protein OIU74_028221 [Salix koriyanagi]|uniref:Uncharacterized protein n=1 Tax=Salix koriyanagi TaxID=2511006 RepID=A0A9Q0ZSW7_9ROSI|nr:hypothetical protein OIU74_028221 [Salix koriyanagi]
MDRASALKEYQCIRLPVTSKKVLHPRPVDRRSRGLALPGHRLFDPMTASAEESEELQQKHMPFSASAPHDQTNSIICRQKTLGFSCPLYFSFHFFGTACIDSYIDDKQTRIVFR